MNYDDLKQRMLKVSGATEGQVEKFLKYCDTLMSNPKTDFNAPETVEQLIRLGEQRLSRSTHQRRKNWAIIFYEKLCNEKYIQPDVIGYIRQHDIKQTDMSEMLNTYYFSSLDNVLDYIGVLAESNGFGAEGGLLFYKSAAILMWVLGQHNIRAILNVHKSDLCAEPYGVLIDGKFCHLSERAWRILDTFAGSDTYLPFPSKRYFKLKDSPYLLRSSRSEKLSYHALASAFQDLNNADERVRGGKKLAMDCLVNNGGFERVYRRVQRGEEFRVKMIAEEISTTRPMASGYRNLYEQWCQRYKEQQQKTGE